MSRLPIVPRPEPVDVEVDGKRVRIENPGWGPAIDRRPGADPHADAVIRRSAIDRLLETALRHYLSRNGHGVRVRLLNHRREGWSSAHVRYEVRAEVGDESGTRREYFDITVIGRTALDGRARRPWESHRFPATLEL